MAACFQGQEELVREGEGLVQPGLGHRQVDEQFFGRLEVFAAPGETADLEERFGSAHQRMSIWQLRRDRQLLPRLALRRPR